MYIFIYFQVIKSNRASSISNINFEVGRKIYVYHIRKYKNYIKVQLMEVFEK